MRAHGLPVVFLPTTISADDRTTPTVFSGTPSSWPKGTMVVNALPPASLGFRMPKPRHPAFFETTLQSILRHLRATTLVMCGVVTDPCVLATVLDVHLRGISSVMPVDTTPLQSRGRTGRTVLHLRESCGVSTPAHGASAIEGLMGDARNAWHVLSQKRLEHRGAPDDVCRLVGPMRHRL
ncbi:isochorismatase family protein [Luteibacter aegosomaticola]|uniref:isochorismatase family protein n=1 Tax=Luteibacter aegosomaticola TaxID=2911538 RepID=UPI003CCCC76E